MSDLYRLVYTSRNLFAGGEEEQRAAIAGLLAVSKRNNARVGVTGALLFNGGSFAQVLEGSRSAVEATFERIQRDPRHSDVSVLQCETVAARGFPNWSMGFVGNSPRGRALWTEVARTTNFDLGRLEGDILFNTLLSIVREEEGDAAQTPVAPSGAGLDVVKLRSELSAHPSGESVTTPPAPFLPSLLAPTKTNSPAIGAQPVEVGVLLAALDEERSRTTALRRKLDEAQIALEAKSIESATLISDVNALDIEVENLRRQRDIWADRAKALVAVLTREPVPGEADIQKVA